MLTEISITNIKANGRFRKDLGDLDDLKASISNDFDGDDGCISRVSLLVLDDCS